MRRRDFIGLAGGLLLFPGAVFAERPAARTFESPAIETAIREVTAAIKNRRLSRMFESCFPNTLDTTIRQGEVDGKPDTFVITGDIDAMWLRDASAQVWPYLPFARDDAALARMLQGVIHRQVRCVLLDPYANAFTFDPTAAPPRDDLTDMKPGVFERKWELDSLCYVIRLSTGYWKATGDRTPFDERWLEAMLTIIRTMREQQRRDGPGPYHFQRRVVDPHDTLYHGYGYPTRAVGLIHSGFRPSDDATIFSFLIPSNLFALAALRGLSEMSLRLANECEGLVGDLEDGLRRLATAHLHGADIYPFEVDGFGSQVLMDDANVPSLLSLPYLGACKPDDPKYLRTRDFVLSDNNPWFFRGPLAEGVGSPHTGPGMIWPISIVMRGLTSQDDQEILQCLRMLVATDAGTGFMHESFDAADAARFSRKWFAWANSIFGEFVLKVHRERPAVLQAV